MLLKIVHIYSKLYNNISIIYVKQSNIQDSDQDIYR